MPTGILGVVMAILPEIAKYGPAAINAFVGIFTSNAAPTQAQWDALIASTATTARQQMTAVLQAHGIDPASPQGVALLALTPQ
jgi:hypothetical protein